jgi:hypothetical protein
MCRDSRLFPRVTRAAIRHRTARILVGYRRLVD